MRPVYAATPWGSCVEQGAATIGCLEPLFRNVVGAIVALSGVALFIMLLVGGFNFLFSGGDQKKLEAAKNTISHAIIGLVVIVSAYLILRTIKVFTGVDVTQFNINVP
ncbi:MAG: pilin [Patescibacteria group bacterium]